MFRRRQEEPVEPVDPVKAVDVTIHTYKKHRVVRGDTVRFTSNIELDGDALIADFDGTINQALARVRELIEANVTVD